MNKLQNTIIAVFAALSIFALASVWGVHNGKDGKDGTSFFGNKAERSNLCEKQNGVEVCTTKVQLASAWDGTVTAAIEGTTTPLRVVNLSGDGDGTATSTVKNLQCHLLEQATTTFLQVFSDKSVARGGSGGYASTTQIGNSLNWLANTKLDFIATTTAAQAQTPLILGNGDAVGIKVAGGTNGTLRIKGWCNLTTETLR